MDRKDFILASRYQVQPGINVVVDILLETELRVEPRIMKVLCILSSFPGQLVTRAYLVKEIWEDYGGGEEGLTHAISSLRKLLNDATKELIETIPKKGYILHAEIRAAIEKPKAGVSKERFGRKLVLYGSAILLVAILVFALLRLQLNEEKEDMEISKAKELMIPFKEVIKKTGENWLNTIVTVAEDSTRYKLKIVGDSRPEFYINGRLVSPDEMEMHLDLINNLKRELRKRSRR